MADTEQLKTYRGNCHCGNFVYEIDVPEIKSAAECNCSICSKKAYLWVYPPPSSDLRIVKGDDNTLTSYSFGTGFASHKFCPKCATPVLCSAPSAPPGRQLSLNARAMQGVNPWDLELTPVDGAGWGGTYQPPKYTGPEPSADIEKAEIYNGSCHCGAVTLALKSAPLDKECPGSVSECSCSICSRNGYIWVFPKREQIVVQGRENLGTYQFAAGVVVKTFCKTCGVNVTNEAAELNEKQLAALQDFMREFHAGQKLQCGLNLRVLNDYNVKDIKEPSRSTFTANIEPLYVNP
ncbi:glutathione-dependent formaldehyde-activating enzyme [Lasiosphaeris hirsuta]|uniref:Glutathione-dependent formaldehyde-activating enzyme n=1 Tax=Lasiosphaeris hirsuta TaxID=260670 RepID=A0AA40DTX7_9PEZI|nr:glutathione-dependent formaldehyde-activating enzyme [Lasiosphaeris hirsuta]